MARFHTFERMQSFPPRLTAGRVCTGCVVFLLGFLSPGDSPAQTNELNAHDWDVSHAGEPVDLSDFTRTFGGRIARSDIAGQGTTNLWFSAAHPDFGAVSFRPADANGPFSTTGAALDIQARRTDGKWRSGLLQTVDKNGHGFAQRYGYFEMTAQFPAGPGGWPAFWLLSQEGLLDRSKVRVEIDVVEWYGADPGALHTSVHLWQPLEPANEVRFHHLWLSRYNKVPSALKGGKLAGFHSYGSMITPEWTIFYFDRSELVRFPTRPEFRTPLYMVVDLAILEKEASAAVSPKDLLVQDVSAYQRREFLK